MSQSIEQHLAELKAKYALGQKMLLELEAKRANIQQTLQNLSGAIQALENELAKTNSSKQTAP